MDSRPHLGAGPCGRRLGQFAGANTAAVIIGMAAGLIRSPRPAGRMDAIPRGAADTIFGLTSGLPERARGCRRAAVGGDRGSRHDRISPLLDSLAGHLAGRHLFDHLRRGRHPSIPPHSLSFHGLSYCTRRSRGTSVASMYWLRMMLNCCANRSKVFLNGRRLDQ